MPDDCGRRDHLRDQCVGVFEHHAPVDKITFERTSYSLGVTLAARLPGVGDVQTLSVSMPWSFM